MCYIYYGLLCLYSLLYVMFFYIRGNFAAGKHEETIMTEFIQVSTTVEHKADAEKIAKGLVEKRFAACVQIIGPLTSYFQWQGKLDSAQEYLCLIKSRNDLFSELEAALKEMHPYEVPEIIAMPITGGGQNYLNWLAAELQA